MSPNLSCQLDQVVNLLKFDLAEKRQGKVDRFRSGQAPAANLMQGFSRLGQFGSDRSAGPQGEENAQGCELRLNSNGFDGGTPCRL